MVKNILVRDFSNFPDRGMYYNKKDDPLSATLLTLCGEEWKRIRTKISPTFSSGKIKTMFDIIVGITDNLVDILKPINGEVNVSENIANFSTDIISNIAFGLESNCLADPNSEIRKYGKYIFSLSPMRLMKFFFSSQFPKIALALRLTSTNPIASDFFLKLFIETVEYREKNKVRRNDFMQILIDLKNSNEGSGLELTELAAESFAFFGGGFGTTSTTITYALYEMAQNIEIQNKLREEVEEAFEKGLTYDTLMELKYLGMVVNETLRKYPIIPLTMRKSASDHKIPGTMKVIPKGVTVMVPILAIHRDPMYYSDPNKFDPERFNDENLLSASTYLPFSEGPRVCVGQRFALLQAKIALAKLIKNVEFSVNSKTVIPLEYHLPSPFMTSKSDVYLSIKLAK